MAGLVVHRRRLPLLVVCQAFRLKISKYISSRGTHDCGSDSHRGGSCGVLGREMGRHRAHLHSAAHLPHSADTYIDDNGPWGHNYDGFLDRSRRNDHDAARANHDGRYVSQHNDCHLDPDPDGRTNDHRRMTTPASPESFAAALSFDLDEFQLHAIRALAEGDSVLVAAPTGAGKTLVAEYAIARAIAAGRKTFYTTPLKALSNQKYGDLVRAYGPDAVGLLTGDNAINGDASVVVMTTEVLRNMIYANSPALHNLQYVVLDEVHYLQNPYRGSVWEEVIIHLDLDVELVCLSATVSNAEEFAEWLRTVRGSTTAVIEEKRPVELRHLYAVGDRTAESLHLLATFVGEGAGELRPNPEAARLDRKAVGPKAHRPRGSKLYAPRRAELVERLGDESLLPVIYFIFSRAACDDAVRQCLRDGLRLTKPHERRELRRIAEQHVAALSDNDLDVLDYDSWFAGFEQGIASHHAGLVPPMKEAVEHAFMLGLVKVVFATETLSLGINMPARSVVIEKLSKFTGEHHENLTPGEYTQLAGRAGRRGLDELGYAVVCWNPFVQFEQVASLASKRTYALRSSFRPTYNMAVNLVQRCDRERAHHLLNLSFAQYHADRDVVALERQLQRSKDQLHKAEALINNGRGDLELYRRLVSEYDNAKLNAVAHRGARLESLRPGDVVRSARTGPVAVLKQDRGRSPGRIMVVTETAKILRLGSADFATSPRRDGTIELPRPYDVRDPKFLAEAAHRLRNYQSDDARADQDRELVDLVAAEAALSAHPAARDPELKARLKAANSLERLNREIRKLESRVDGRTETLARTFDRVLGLLEGWGYVQEWTLTDAGAMLARLYTEGDLLLAEAIRRGILDDLDPGGVAAMVSCIAYERRGPDSDVPVPPRKWPSKEISTRAKRLDGVWQQLLLAERDARLPETRQPDPGFIAVISGWVNGTELIKLLDDHDMTGGDFVRTIKQIIDLLRQVGQIALEPSTAAAARAAAEACMRGVVLASSHIGVVEY